MLDSTPVLWWKLINEAEALRESSGWGLANVWGHIHRNDYRRARQTLNVMLNGFASGWAETDAMEDATAWTK